MSETAPVDVLASRNRELSILNAIATALNESVDLSASLETALSLVAELLNVHAGWVWLLHQDTGEPYLAAAMDLPPALAEFPERMEGTCYCLDTFRAGDLRGAANVNVITCTRLKWLTEGTEGLRFHSSIPLYARGKKLGVMNVASSEWRQLSPDDLEILRTIGDMLGIAVERARLFTRSSELGAVEERNRLAREIHDTLAQGLSATAMQLDAAEALLEAGAEPDRVRSSIQRALKTTRACLEEVRRSVLDLRAAPLEGRTLSQALAELCAATASQIEKDVRFECIGGSRPLPVRVEAAMYRIAQEALANVGVHAGAQRVTVQLSCLPKRAAIVIQDDGAGFRPAETPVGRYGLIGMRERARLLGGSLRVESAPGAGTRVEASIPLD